MTSPADEIETEQDPDGLVNPGFIVEEPTRIQTRDLQPGITTNRGYSHSHNSLPDILNSHLPPPYEAVVVESNPRRRRRRGENPEKSCCHSCWTSLTRFKWLLWTLSLLGVCCALAGVVLGALHFTGSSFMTLSIMFIGLGIIMIIVVLIGWRCTPRGHEPCHLLFNLGEYSRHRRRHSSAGRVGRRREIGRRTYWSGGVIYSDHQYRQPPPSYQAAMQDFERQLLARMNNLEPAPNSPPPTYKSHATIERPNMRNIFPEQPPIYTSRPGTLIRSNRVNTLDANRQNNLDNDTVRTERQLNIANITVHVDSLSRDGSVDDNLSYREEREVPCGTMERASVHTCGQGVTNTSTSVSRDSTLRYGTAERSAVQCLEESIRGGEGIVNTSMVLDEDDERTEALKNAELETMNTASLLRAADQNLQRFYSRNSSVQGESSRTQGARVISVDSTQPRFGSARASSQRGRQVIDHISHMRSSSASGVDFHFHEHIATLV